MNPRFEAAWEIHNYLLSQNITYAIIGGIAVHAWGDQRFTKDVDLTIATSLELGSEPLVKIITEHFPSRSSNPFELARNSRMILVTASNEIEVDISLALPGYEDEMFNRVTKYEIEAGKSIILCSPEDLIIHKSVAGRPQDLIDIQGVIFRQRENLDLGYIRDWLRQFAKILENSSLITNFESAWEKLINPDSV